MIEKFDSDLTIINSFVNDKNKKEYLEWLKKCHHNVNIESFESIYGKQLNQVVRRK
jgi:folylpolyglutamate synthase/dihydropteroate synthase